MEQTTAHARSRCPFLSPRSSLPCCHSHSLPKGFREPLLLFVAPLPAPSTFSLVARRSRPHALTPSLAPALPHPLSLARDLSLSPLFLHIELALL
eukprot:260428-Pleurochrysis_carterae.AAC.1